MTRTERQTLGIEKWKKAGCRASLCWATGTGKTVGALTAVRRVLSKNSKFKVVIIVPTDALRKQWLEKIGDFDITGDINVWIINSAIKQSFYCDFLVLDECHRYNSVSFSKLFEITNPTMILGLTATYERLDAREKEIMDKYCPPCDTITIEEATANGWLSPYREYKVTLDVDLTEYKKANKEFLQHFSFFDYQWDIAMNCVTNVFAQQAFAKQLHCDQSEVKAHAYAWMRALQFRKKFIANHPKKIEVAKKIIEARKDKKIITFDSSIKQCESYGIGVTVHSQKKQKENLFILDEFSKIKSGVIHSSKMLIEGLDCPGLSVAIVTGFNSSKTELVQKIGRTIRLEPGKIAEVYVLVLKGTVEEQWFKKSHEKNSFLVIDEEELDFVLNNIELDKTIQTQETVNNLFRY